MIVLGMIVILTIRLSTNLFLHDIKEVNYFLLNTELAVALKWYYYDLITLITAMLVMAISFATTYRRASFIIYKILLTAAILSVFRVVSYLLFGLVYDHYFLAFLLFDILTYSVYYYVKKILYSHQN